VITDVTIASPPVVRFQLADGAGDPVVGLPADAVSFKIAKLIPGTDGNPSAWQSYVNRIEEPGVGPGTEPAVQAATENGAAGTLVDLGDGSYEYTFALDVANVTEPVSVSYSPTLTHRVSLEVRGYEPVPNPIFDFRPSDGATSGLFSREIATTETCNTCHERLAEHGDARFEMQECVLCHNPGSVDANSGNSVDMTVMTHKIHYGANLPSVVSGGDYCLYGNRDRINCYGDVEYPQAITNCTSCHDAADPETPDAAGWFERPTDAACGSCHDDVDFATGVNHGSGIPASNAECATCHANDPASSLEVRQAHRVVATERRQNYSFNILNIDSGLPGTSPSVSFSVTDPANGDAPYDLNNDPDLVGSPLRFFVAWDTVDYSNAGNGIANAQPERTDVYENGVLQATNNGDYTYTIDLGGVAPSASGSGVVTLEGRVDTTDGRVPVTTGFRYFAITDDPAEPEPRRTVIELGRCNDCHEFVTFHGSNRNDSIESCQVCHNADAARAGDPSAGPMDMKHFVHRLHAVDDIRYPQRVSNCLGCHTDDGFYPTPAGTGVRATSLNQGPDPLDPTDNKRVTPNSAACGVCHSTPDAQAHMVANGGSFDACQELDGTVRQRVDACGPAGDKSGALVVESCLVCHGPGRSADTALEHGLDLPGD
jgi:OmcA/MtrC family decaheme c-type cytochrome